MSRWSGPLRGWALAVAAVLILGALTEALTADATQRDRTAPTRSVAAPACVSIVNTTLLEVAQRVYDAATSGIVARQAANRVRAYEPLIRAVARDDRRATLAAMHHLQFYLVHYLQITRHGHVLATVGSDGVGPSSGVLRDGTGHAVGRFTLASLKADYYIAGVHELIGGQTLLYRGTRLIAPIVGGPRRLVPAQGSFTSQGVVYHAVSLRGRAFPSGTLRITLLIPPWAYMGCAGISAEIRAGVLGRVAVNIYQAEAAGRATQAQVGFIERSRRFAAAVAAGDPVRMRAAIVDFFRTSRHIVRVRALRARRVVFDLGGPFVLAPVRGRLVLDGRRIGSFVTSIQDDAGFVLLARQATGAQIILRTSRGQIPYSTLRPGPAHIPDRGPVRYRGHSYEAFSFTGQEFPRGRLRISVLVPRR